MSPSVVFYLTFLGIVVFATLCFWLQYQHYKLDAQEREAELSSISTGQMRTNDQINSQEQTGRLHLHDERHMDSVDFVNKDCVRLEDFIINDQINGYDLRKLAELNQCQLSISEGWYALTIELIKELHALGWDKRVYTIKEKYGRLVFSTAHDFMKNNLDLIVLFEDRSEKTCERCGEPGRERGGGGIFIACRKHYLESRGRILLTENGFIIDNIDHDWTDFNKGSFEHSDLQGSKGIVSLSLRKEMVMERYTDRVYFQSRRMGFGRFIRAIPIDLQSQDYERYQNHTIQGYCEICGYEAIYNSKCECCENDTWDRYRSWMGENARDKKAYISMKQIIWELDDGERYASIEGIYRKNPEHKVIYTDEEYNEYLSYENE